MWRVERGTERKRLSKSEVEVVRERGREEREGGEWGRKGEVEIERERKEKE